jgi:hypothetical protein
VTAARRTIAVKINFRTSNKKSLKRRAGAYQSSRENRPTLVLKNEQENTAFVSSAV